MADMVMPTDEEGWQWVRRRGFGANLRGREPQGATVWHVAGAEGRTDMCRWLKAQGVLDEINMKLSDYTQVGRDLTPLMVAIAPWASSAEDVTIAELEGTARWMMANGADINAMDNNQCTIFAAACAAMSFEFVRELADMVPPEHLTLPEKENGLTPMSYAMICNEKHGVKISKMLILRGLPAMAQAEFSNLLGVLKESLKLRYFAVRRQLVSWVSAELAPRDTFVNLVLGCGVHGSRDRDRDLPQAQRSQLHKLRGFINTQARINIAQYLGVRVGEKAGRLRRAAATLTPQRTPAPALALAPASALFPALFQAPAPALATQLSVLRSPSVLVMTTLFLGTWLGIWQAERTLRLGGCRGRLRL